MPRVVGYRPCSMRLAVHAPHAFQKYSFKYFPIFLLPLSKMTYDIYKPELWTNFFLLVGTGAATLTGLVFVAMSLNIKVISVDITHRNRAIGTLTGLAAVFMMCAFVLMGGQSNKAVGAELLVVSFLASIVYVSGYLKAYKSSSGASLLRTATGTTLYLAQMIGAIMLISGTIAGLYIAAVALVSNTCYMITGAWLLIVGVYTDKSK